MYGIFSLVWCYKVKERKELCLVQNMKRLMEQIIKFGIVGFFCFLIDYGITVVFTNVFGVHYLVSKFLGFVVSAIVNYILSIKFVFTNKKEMDKKKEFSVFIILSAFGLIINEIVMFICMDVLFPASGILQRYITRELMVSVSSVVATGIVMIYNFISRKLFLERK